MDPLTIAGLVSNILQFISFGHEVLSTSKEIMSSAKGAPQDVEHLQILIHDIKQTATAASAATSLGSHKQNATIISIASECQTLADDLLKNILKFESAATKSNGPAVRVQALKRAAIFTWKKKRIVDKKIQLLELEARLSKWWSEEEQE